jgi:hypothetical protein
MRGIKDAPAETETLINSAGNKKGKVTTNTARML